MNDVDYQKAIDAREPDMDKINEAIHENLIDPKDVDEVVVSSTGVTYKETPNNLPEAPYSVTITGYYKGFSTMKTHRSFEPIKNEIVVASIEDMITKGFLPSWNSDTNGKALPKAEVTPATTTPTCPYHNKPMTLREGKFGKFWSCSTKLADDTWCKYVPSLKVEDMP
jgi:hypothetical protein